MSDKLIRKYHSKNYSKVIEVKVPVRFYWDGDNYDGFEFGSLLDCSPYQIKILGEVIERLGDDMDYGRVARYLESNHKSEWNKLLIEMDAKELNIPTIFLEEFKDEDGR